MSENPYHNEPGFEHVFLFDLPSEFPLLIISLKERVSGDAKTYNEIIRHETLRVAVCEMLENRNSCPKQL